MSRSEAATLLLGRIQEAIGKGADLSGINLNPDLSDHQAFRETWRGIAIAELCALGGEA